MLDAGDYLAAKDNIEAQITSTMVLLEFNKVLLEHVNKRLEECRIKTTSKEEKKSIE